MLLDTRKVSASINMTPLIDVLLVLLILFMLLPHHTVGLKSEIPQPSPQDRTAPPNPQDLVLRIRKDHSIDINSQPIMLAELEARLKALFGVRPDGVLFVDGAGELEFAEVATVIDIARGAGVDRIGLITAKER
jgi:biopolymer transport protein ExbD